ncbi:NAD(P)/FAD-dependent oxidoreductase [Pararhodonellum marinum]|uniref:NAD(P)/FAD-dependent oxidoreductase n=1 Tax=Pararhodonellum marinum TaxID=2755358 RepID=UPI0018902580|nr:FAD/NAD(P)-binding oxidoreductase [Pararhodonellum marinum]
MHSNSQDFCNRNPNRRIVIIGNGIAGVTCARQIRKMDNSARITIISGETKHFFSRTALMYIYMGHMKYEHTKPYEDFFWEKNRLELKQTWVKKVDFEAKNVIFEDDEPLNYDILVLATGSKNNKYGWPGQELAGVQGLYSKQDLDLMETQTKGIKKAVIVGGGLIGIEMAEMLRSRNVEVTFLVRENSFWDHVLPPEESDMINRHIREHHIDLRLNTELKEILDDGQGRAKAVLTNHGETIPCEFVGLTIGVSPNIDFLIDSTLATKKGILADLYFKTNIPNVFAIGDCVEFHKAPASDRKNIEQVWYTGRMHGETLAHNLCNEPVKYQPGVWFNSAKFFDIEYQTYGWVPPLWDSDFNSFYWEHPEGKIGFRMLFESQSKIIKGVNAFGLRLSHAFFDQVIKERWNADKVIQHLGKANFNAEFYEKVHKDISKRYDLEMGTNVSNPKRNFLKRIMNK